MQNWKNIYICIYILSLSPPLWSDCLKSALRNGRQVFHRRDFAPVCKRAVPSHAHLTIALAVNKYRSLWRHPCICMTFQCDEPPWSQTHVLIFVLTRAESNCNPANVLSRTVAVLLLSWVNSYQEHWQDDTVNCSVQQADISAICWTIFRSNKLLPCSGSKNKPRSSLLIPWLTLGRRGWKQFVPLKSRWIFNGLHGGTYTGWSSHCCGPPEAEHGHSSCGTTLS
jgi:hypothetical protein